MNQIKTLLLAAAILLAYGASATTVAQRCDGSGPVGVQQHDRNMDRSQDPAGNPNRYQERNRDASRSDDCVGSCDDPQRTRSMERPMHRLREHVGDAQGRFQDAVQEWARVLNRLRMRTPGGR
jgi:hypothetical protein